MSVVLCILFAGLGAALGRFLSIRLGDAPDGQTRAGIVRGRILGTLWGGLAGLHLGTTLTLGDVAGILWVAIWPMAILAALAWFGIVARRFTLRATTDPSVQATARRLETVAFAMGAGVMTILFLALIVVIPGLLAAGDSSFKHLPQAAQNAAMGKFGLTFLGGCVGAVLLAVLRNEPGVAMIGGSAGQFCGGMIGSLVVDQAPFSAAAKSGLAAATGGLCTSFEWGLAGAIGGTALGAAGLVLWVLLPDLGKSSEGLPDPDDLPPNLSKGVGFARLAGNFAKAVDENGPAATMRWAIGIFGTMGAISGFVIGPALGGSVLRALELA